MAVGIIENFNKSVIFIRMGVVMFFGSEEGSEHFSDLIEAMWTLWYE